MTLLRAFSIGLSAAFILTSTFAAAPQPTSRIAAIVNDDIITISDVEERINLFILTSGIKNGGDKANLRHLVLQSLIFERIQHRAAESKGIKISEKSVDEAFEKIAQNNNSTVAKMEKYFASQGISLKSFREMIRTQLAWVEYVRTQHGYSMQVSEAEIETALTKIKSRSGQSQFSYIEVFFAVDSTQREEEVRQVADRIAQQLRSGANTEMVAQQFSQASSAKNGGKVTLISESSLDPALTSALKKATTDSIVGPIRIPGGFVIVKLLQHHFAGDVDPKETEVKFIQVSFAVNDQMSEADAEQVKTHIDELQKIRGEAAFKKRAEEIGGKTTSQTTKLGQLPADFASVVKKTAPGQCLPPVRTEEGVLLMMPCSFKKPEFKMPTHDEVMLMLQEEKVGKQAQRDRMRLYAAAYIDIKDKNLQTPSQKNKKGGKAESKEDTAATDQEPKVAAAAA
jgi:peptidyl-prolyl cis-trans isomerase SurA